MTTIQLIEAFVIGAVLSSFAEWIFFGVLFHKKYFTYPEVWRPNNNWRVPVSSVIGLLTPLAFITLVMTMHLSDFHDIVHLALLMWVAGPLPLVATNHFFFKLHPAITFTHIMGWLAKFLCATAGVIIAQML